MEHGKDDDQVGLYSEVSDRMWRLADWGTARRGRLFRSRTIGMRPQRRGQLAARLPADTRSPIWLW